MWKLLSFLAATAFLIYISRASLTQIGSHGFFRFLAWECILALLLLNALEWFVDPFSLHQIIAWLLLFSSLVLLALGFRALRRLGRSTDERSDDPGLLGFEKTTKLVTSGIYGYIRHPLYSSLLFLAWGAFFKSPDLPGGLLASLATVFLFATAKADERECLRYFGASYRDYIRRTKRFLPFVF